MVCQGTREFQRLSAIGIYLRIYAPFKEVMNIQIPCVLVAHKIGIHDNLLIVNSTVVIGGIACTFT